MKRRAFSLLLSLTLLLSLALPATTAYAEEGSSNKGMEISKTATANQDGSYTITLEAYATGEKVISEITKDVPTDIVLVLDQSGSMSNEIGTVLFREYENAWYSGNIIYHTRNQDYYEYRNNGGSGNLWHKLADDSYVSVSVNRQEQVGYTEITNGRNESSNNGQYTNIYYNRNNLYAKVSGEYVSVSVTRSGRNTYTYTYTLPDGRQIASSQGARTTPTISGTDDNKLYLASIDDTQTVYTYTYTDSNNNVKNIGTSTGATTVFSPTLYERVTNPNGGGSRLNALKNAANAFASAVATKAAGEDGNISTTADNIDHRIAVVGYADTNWDYGYNTGVFIGSRLYRYEDDASGVYSTALQDMRTTTGKNNVTASLNALQASGATRTDYGLTMANGILNANPVPQGETRNRVVIVFTDGSPTSLNGFQRRVANSAISTASTIKDGGTTVYSIGIFSGADANSAGTEPTYDLDQYDDLTAACNWFMQKVSSNNGRPQSPSYYLSASDAASLNSIFEQISDQIETGGSSSKLTSNAVVKDIISPQFTLPEGATANSITLETYACTGKNANGDYTWSKNRDAMGEKATVNETDGTVSVSGFDFAENYVGTVTDNGSVTYRGHKLVIKFNVKAKDGFLGGNDVYTNDSAGVYENSSATEPVLTFNRPQVNVQIKDVAVTAADKNVYLLGDLTADQIKSGATVKCGNVSLNLTQDNYGLQSWQTDYVNITVEIKDAAGNAVSNLNSLSDDTTYTVSAKVSPKTTTPTSNQGATATEKTGTASGKINVFKPELTCTDSTVYYGNTVPAEYTGNLTSTKWKHGTTEDSTVTMIGTEPALEMTCTPDSAKIVSGKVNTKQDIAVDVAVKIGTTNVTDKTTFNHTACDANCTDPVTGGKFWLHVKTCQLTITKTGGAGDESYVFDIYKDDQEYTELSVWGNDSVTIYELPVGSYTIVENGGWSWRYDADNGSAANLTAQNPTGSITCTNTKTENYWLNGFSTIVQNIFGQHN